MTLKPSRLPSTMTSFVKSLREGDGELRGLGVRGVDLKQLTLIHQGNGFVVVRVVE